MVIVSRVCTLTRFHLLPFNTVFISLCKKIYQTNTTNQINNFSFDLSYLIIHTGITI